MAGTLEQPQTSPPLRVMQLVDSLRVGGKERQVVELLKGLVGSKMVESVVVTMGTEQFYVPDVEKLGLPLVYLLRRVRWDPTVFARLFKILRRFRPQIIHTNSEMASFYAWPLARLLGIKLINGSIRNAFSGRGLSWEWHRLLLRMADARVANSEAGFASRGWSGKSPGNYVIYNGFDVGRFENLATQNNAADFDPRGRKVVGMVAEFSDYKDFPTFIHAAQIILSRRSDVMFVAVGGGKNLEACRQMVSKDESSIQFLGARKDIESLVRRMDIGVLCTFTEGISNSVMEFMAACKPVVVTDGGGSSELVLEGETGFLIPPSNPQAVAEKIEFLLNNDTNARLLGERGRRSLEGRFSLQQLAQNTLRMYEETLK